MGHHVPTFVSWTQLRVQCCFVLFLFDFFPRTIIVIFHKTLAHFKIWDYDFCIPVKLFSQIALPQDLIYSLGYLALNTEQHLLIYCPLSWRLLLTYLPLCSPTSSIFQNSLLDFDNSNGVSINNNNNLYSLLSSANWFLCILLVNSLSPLNWRSFFFQLLLKIWRPRIIQSLAQTCHKAHNRWNKDFNSSLQSQSHCSQLWYLICTVFNYYFFPVFMLVF